MKKYPTATDYHSVILNTNGIFQDPVLRSAKPLSDQLGMPVVNAGNFALTFFFEASNGEKWVVRCFKSHSANRSSRYQAISKFIKCENHSIFVGVEYLEKGILVNGQWYPIVKMPYIQGVGLHKFIEQNISRPTSLKVSDIREKFRKLVVELEKMRIAHGDLQHGNILVVDNRLVLIDYDGMYLSELKDLPSNESGHRAYQHPARNNEYGPELDRFSAIVIYLALQGLSHKPDLWDKYSNGDNLLFRSEDFCNPHASRLLDELSSVPGLKLQIENFRTICQSSLNTVPPLQEFLKGKLLLPPIARNHVTRSLSYPVIEATDIQKLRDHNGEMVQVTGKITVVKSGTTKFGSSYVFLNFGDFTKGCFTAVIWSDTLQMFRQQQKDPQNFLDKSVTITGRLSRYAPSNGKPAQPQIIIELVTQIFDETSIIPPDPPPDGKSLPPLNLPTPIDFGNINVGQAVERLIPIRNLGQKTLNIEIENIPSWLQVTPKQARCVPQGYIEFKLRAIRRSNLFLQPQIGVNQTLSHELRVKINKSVQRVHVKAVVLTQEIVPPPVAILQITPKLIEFGVLNWGEDRVATFTVTNNGTSILTGRIQNLPQWLEANPPYFKCGPKDKIKIEIKFLSDQLQYISNPQYNGQVLTQHYSGQIKVDTRLGIENIEVKASVKIPTSIQIKPNSLQIKTALAGMPPSKQSKVRILPLAVIIFPFLALLLFIGMNLSFSSQLPDTSASLRATESEPNSITVPIQSVNIPSDSLSNVIYSDTMNSSSFLTISNDTAAQSVQPIILSSQPTLPSTLSPTLVLSPLLEITVNFLCKFSFCDKDTSVQPALTESLLHTITITETNKFTITNRSSVKNTSRSDCEIYSPINLVSPIEESIDSTIRFTWQWDGDLPEYCGFEVKMWRDGEIPRGVHDAIYDNTNGVIQRRGIDLYSLSVSNIRLTPSVRNRSSEYYWTVAVVKIKPVYEDTSTQAAPVRIWIMPKD